MRHIVDAQLMTEAQRFRLRFACEDCAYFTPETATCAELYPNQEHRERALQVGEELCFCKRFELA